MVVALLHYTFAANDELLGLIHEKIASTKIEYLVTVTHSTQRN
jgi:hypothetical protein